MAKKVVVELVDDLDNSAIEEGEGGTVSFALEGVNYEIDLGAENIEKLRGVLAPYIEKGRRTGRASGPRKSSGSANSGLPTLNQQIREWAKTRGMDVPAKGPLPKRIREAYESAS
ncbi:histone-like nucleoid-structuring protein Lsr2 [Arenivirga flava]|uniref:Lsr2 family protein n=1 Tax=Arenivirga flava TaxID=1930060 RepID=A0AA37UES6_9MICO|nr:Lsr2 family protein [Arenivirga flava]GMA27694.1 Lsr2 family protein [Arenivirga flava]